jgi:hypothetical protein
MASAVRFTLILVATFLNVLGLRGQETCGEEVKLLLSPTQVQSATLALQARKETHGRIYFYDTPSLALLSKGVILRAREGAEIDITAKLRPLTGEKFHDPSSGRERYKCEVDLNDGVGNKSFSVQKRFVDEKVPETGEAIYQQLSEGQKTLLEDSKVQIDWKTVKRIAEIQSTSWTTRAHTPLGKLNLELWEWQSGSVLEVSTKVGPDGGQSTYVALRDLATKNGLVLNTNQRSKTAIALEEIAASHPQ